MTLTKRKVVRALAVVTALAFLAGAALPAIAGSENNVGRHAYKFNIIGRPNDWNGDDSNANTKTIFIGLNSYEGEGTICEEESGVTDDVAGENVFTVEPVANERLYFTGTTDGSFYVIDRDATDGSARIAIPETSGTGGYDVWLRILGKPGGCLDADGFAEADLDEDGVTDHWFFSGHLDANRKSGVPGKVSVNDMFDVWVCVAVDIDGVCTDYDEISVFDDMFTDYFWNLNNQGLRNMQMIFYG